jgi:hypothetical protein
MDFFTKWTPEEFEKEMVGYLKENGIPEDYLTGKNVAQRTKNPEEFEEINNKIIELLSHKVPKHSIFPNTIYLFCSFGGSCEPCRNS